MFYEVSQRKWSNDMPCRVDDYEYRHPAERTTSASSTAKTTSKPATPKNPTQARKIEILSAKVDYLRDVIWYLLNEEETVSAADLDTILSDQEKHRQVDLDRVVVVLSKNLKKNKEKLQKVLDADITRPLYPQLGFNPDNI